MANPGTNHAVELEAVNVVRGGRHILRDITCRIPRGRCTVVLGPNGCGKTTLTRTMTGHMFVNSGHVRVLDEQIGKTDIRLLRQRVAVINPVAASADLHISGAVVDEDLSAMEVVLTGFFGTVGLYDTPTDEHHELARTMLSTVGLDHRVQQAFYLLSTGEQRRCLIARALAITPELLILDEPTAGLDLVGREQVLATVETLLARPDPPTIILITHHVEEIPPRTDNVLLMCDGVITGTGPPETLITPETLTATFGCKVFVRRLHGRYWLEVLPEAWHDLLAEMDPPT